MTATNDLRTSQRSTVTVQSGLIGQLVRPGPEHHRLEVFLGKWINEGYTVASTDVPSVKILTSDVYEWMPGGFFVLHTAYGRIGDIDVGGVEIIGYDAATKTYRTHFFDSQGKTQTAHHERLDEQGNWVPSMEVTLTKVK